MKLAACFLALLCFPVHAGHLMPGMADDPWRVPKWEEAFAAGPFGLPKEAPVAGLVLPGSQGGEAHGWLVRGWAAVHRLDDREAERCFRLVLVKSPDEPMALFGLCLANESHPGRAALFIRRAGEFAAKLPAMEAAMVRAFMDFYAEVGVRQEVPSRGALLKPPADDRQARRAEKSSGLLAALAKIAAANPAHAEAKALLLRERLLLHGAGGSADEFAAVDQLLEEIQKGSPGHPAGNCRWLRWSLSVGPARPAEMLAESLRHWPPESIRARLAAAEALERQGFIEAAIPWTESAVAAASAELQACHFQPGAMADFHAALGRLSGLHASAGQADRAIKAAEAAGGAELAATLLRLEAWDELLQREQGGVKAALSTEGQAVWWHGAAIASFRLGRKEEALARLALLREAPVRARQDMPSPTPEALERLAQLAKEVEAELFLLQVEKQQALPAVAALTTRPAADRARLALRCGDAGAAARLAAEAEAARPGALPETAILFEATPAGGPQAALVPKLAAVQRRLSAAGSGPAVERLREISARLQPPVADEPIRFPVPAPDATPWWTAPEAPEFSLVDATGTPHSSAENRGRVTVYLFFLGAKCEHCLRQLNRFDKWHPAFAAAGIRVVAASTDAPDGATRTLAGAESDPARRPFPFPILADPAHVAFRRWQAFDHIAGKPIHGTYLTDAAGRIAWQTTGAEPFMGVELVLRLAKDLAAGPAAAR